MSSFSSSSAATRHRGDNSANSASSAAAAGGGGVGAKPTLSETLARAVTPKADWANKDELLDVVYWQRQILSAGLGLLWGLLPLKGLLGLALFLLINCAAVYLFACVFQGVDEEEYGGLGELLKEGLMTSFASFLVLWIIVYDGCHADSSGASAAASAAAAAAGASVMS